MSDFQKMLDRFNEHESHLRELGDALVQRYPQSQNLIQLSQELGAAIDGLGALKTRLGDAIHEAESQTTLAADLKLKMDASPVYQQLTERDRAKLTEYLLANEAGLATDAELEAYVLRSLEQKSEAELLAEFSKAHILELGQAIQPGVGEFDAYKFGTEALRKQFGDPQQKQEILADLAKVLLKESPGTVLKLFYAAAFKQDETPEPPAQPATPAAPKPAELKADPGPAPIVQPEVPENASPYTPEPSTNAPEPEAAAV
jgi:hypothetical protein